MSITDLNPKRLAELRELGYSVDTVDEALEAVRRALGLTGNEAMLYLSGATDTETAAS